jgi:hypothetical protein
MSVVTETMFTTPTSEGNMSESSGEQNKADKKRYVVLSIRLRVLDADLSGNTTAMPNESSVSLAPLSVRARQ